MTFRFKGEGIWDQKFCWEMWSLKCLNTPVEMPRRWLIQIWGLLPNLAYKELAEKLPPTPFSQYFSSISSWPAIRFQRLGLGLYIVLSSRPAGELGAHTWDSSSGIKGRPKCWLRVEGAPLLCQLLSALHLLRAAPPRLLSSSPALLEPASQSSPTLRHNQCTHSCELLSFCVSQGAALSEILPLHRTLSTSVMVIWR